MLTKYNQILRVIIIPNPVKKRIFYLDQLRALAIIAVVLVHISLVYLVSSRIDIHSLNWLVSNFFYSICRFCVPIFLMISGILLLNKDYTYENFIKRRYTRVILPYLFWGVITIIFSLFFVTKTHLTLGFVTGIMGGITSVYWFVWLILLIYLFMPILTQ